MVLAGLHVPRPALLKGPASPAARAVATLDRSDVAEAGVTAADARITVSRQSKDDVGFREIFVSLDGESIGVLRHGESVTTDVRSGPHRLRAHNTLFWKTHDIVVKPGEHVRFTAVNRAGWGTFGMLFILGAMPVYLTFERLPADTPSLSAHE